VIHSTDASVEKRLPQAPQNVARKNLQKKQVCFGINSVSLGIHEERPDFAMLLIHLVTVTI